MNLFSAVRGCGMLLTSMATDASTDLFSGEWTQGNLFEIQGMVNIFGHIAVVVISAVGFAIVIFSILKNALSGLYVVNPPFWDRVDELKKDMVDGASGLVNDTLGKSNNLVAKKMGGALTLILGYIPNIKSLTDFDDSDGEVVDKKQYFIKSIPLLVAQIFIGTLIFMGYPTKIASWVGNGGTYIIDSVINNVDPVETVQKISDGIVVYSLASDGSQDPFEVNINQFSRQMLKTVQTKYTDMKKDSTQNVALTIEANLSAAFTDQSVRDVLGADQGYNFTSSCIYTTVTPTTSGGFKEIATNLYASQASNGTITYRYYVNGTDLNSGSTLVSASDWFVLSVTCTPEAVSNASTASLIAFGGIQSQATIEGSNASTSQIKLPILGLTFGTGDSEGYTEIKGTLGKQVTVDVVNCDDGSVLQSFQAKINSASVGQTSNISASLYFSGTEKDRLTEALNAGNVYFRVNLTGTWNKDIKDGTATTTVRVNELRLKPNSTNVSYALTSWTDVDVTTSEGVSGSSLGSEFLRRTSISGSQQ